MIKVQKKHIKFIIPILLSIIFIIIAITFTLESNDINKLSKISKEIISINSSLPNPKTNDNFDYDKTCDTLKKNLTSLNNINSTFEQMKFKKSSSEDIRNSLSNYINLNISLYNSALDILNNQSEDNFSDLYKQLIKYENDISQSTTSLSDKGINISFPSTANNFFHSINKYVNAIYKSNRETDITSSQKLDFSLYLDNVVSNFSNLKEDVQPALLKIREDNRNLSILLDDINNKKSDFNKIKNDSYSVSIPSGAQNSYEALEDMLNSYEIYINSLQKSVETEINKPNSTDIDSNYDDSFDKYKSFLSYFDSFENAINDYKNK